MKSGAITCFFIRAGFPVVAIFFIATFLSLVGDIFSAGSVGPLDSQSRGGFLFGYQYLLIVVFLASMFVAGTIEMILNPENFVALFFSIIGLALSGASVVLVSFVSVHPDLAITFPSGGMLFGIGSVGLGLGIWVFARGYAEYPAPCLDEEGRKGS